MTLDVTNVNHLFQNSVLLQQNSSSESKKSSTDNGIKLQLNATQTCEQPRKASGVSAAVAAAVHLQPFRVITLATEKVILQGLLWSLHRAE